MDKINRINKKMINILMIVTTILFGMFVILEVLNFQLKNLVNLPILKNLEIVYENLRKFDQFQDIAVLIMLIPIFIIIMLFLLIMKFFEKHNKKRISAQLVHVVISFIFLYFLYYNLTSTNFIKIYIEKLYNYTLINIVLGMLLIFVSYYIVYKIICIVKTMRSSMKHKKEINNYKIVFYPFLIIVIIVLIVNIFNTLLVYFIIQRILAVINIGDFINLVNIFGDTVNFANIMPDFIVNLVKVFGVNMNTDINVSVIDVLLDNTVFRIIDNRIDGFTMNFLSNYIFVSFYNYVIGLALCGLIIWVEYKNKYKLYYNFIILLILIAVLYSIDNFFFNLITTFCFMFEILFVYLIIFTNKEQNKRVITTIKDKVKEAKENF